MTSLRVVSERMRRDFYELSAIGSTGDGGVNRPALSLEHLEARRWFRERIQSDGLTVHEDGAGNLSARSHAAEPDAPTLLLGSHLDSVPYGGRFDGALGVIAALEVIRTVVEARLSLPVHLEAIDFTDEEGTLVGLLGSRALAGDLPEEELIAPRGGLEALDAGLRRAGLTKEGILTARRDPKSLSAFLEVHIEQGPRLLSGGHQIGIVSALVGIRSMQLSFIGQPDHAGTTPMDARKDAGLGGAAFTMAARRIVMDKFPGCVVNIGKMGLEPGAFNIVPGRATLNLEYRAPEERQLEAIERALLDEAASIAMEFGLAWQHKPQGSVPPVLCSARVQDAFGESCRHLGLDSISVLSWAGHDTMALAGICPSGMIFIPSLGGSHSPREDARWEDCINGANVLLMTTLALSGMG